MWMCRGKQKLFDREEGLCYNLEQLKLGQYVKRGRESTGGVGPMSCESHLVGRTCASALVDGPVLCLSEG